MEKMPITVKRSLELLGLLLIGVVIVVGNQIIMPLLMAFFISIVLLPVNQFFIRMKLPEPLAIFISILLLAILLAGVVWFFSSHVSALIADFPLLQKNVTLHLNALSAG